MSIILEGIVYNSAVDAGSKIVQFTVQESNGRMTNCRYKYEDIFPLQDHDCVQCEGDFEVMIIDDNTTYNFFMCKFVTARYEFDLLLFLMTYMPYASKEIKSSPENLTEYYRKITDKIYEFSRMSMGGISTDDICSLFGSLYSCILQNDETQLEDFTQFVFNNKSTKALKRFLRIWNNDVLIRPLQLMGLSEPEIKAIHIPLDKAYTIVKTNPFRLPHYSNEKALKIAKSHLRLNFSDPELVPIEITNFKQLDYLTSDAIRAGEICRLVYKNVTERKWTSTPISMIKERFPSYDKLKHDLEKYYFVIEEMNHLYFKPIYYMEKHVSATISELIKKPDRTELRPAVFPGRIPSEEQQKAVNTMITKHISMTNGGPGTGKTTTMSETIRNIHMNGEKVIAGSFTGAATTRIRDTAKNAGVFDMCEIMTLHMMIALQNSIKDMKVKYFIFDEVSMINIGLISQFFSAYRNYDFQLILIGDINQLEPIEYGNFLSQIIKTPLYNISTVTLTHNFRSQNSPNIISLCSEIIDSNRIFKCEKINWYRYINEEVKSLDEHGNEIVSNVAKEASDYRFLIGGIELVEQLIAYYAGAFKKNDTLSIEDNLANFAIYRDKFTIISPYRKIVDQINIIFQKYFISFEKRKVTFGNDTYYIGDRVMKLVNDYGLKVMNGEKGKVVDVKQNYIVVEFRNDPVTRSPYIDRIKYTKMREFVKSNNIKFFPFNKSDSGEIEPKTPDQIKTEITELKRLYVMEIPQQRNNETYTERLNRENIEAVNLFFDLLELYPFVMSNLDNDAEFLNVKNITLAYALTTHKSQGDEFEYVIYTLTGNSNLFVTLNNLYTGLSRAKVHLDLIVESIDCLHYASNNRSKRVHDKLSERICSLLPAHMVEKIEIVEPETEQYEENYDFDDCEYENDYDESYNDYN